MIERGGSGATPTVMLQQLQGDGESSPYEGQTVQVSGYVIADGRHGFFIQDAEDYGIWVYNYDFSHEVGDEVVLVGLVNEYYGLTELMDIDLDVSRVVSHGHTIDATTVRTGAIGERHEGILVRVTGTCTMHDIGHGEWIIDDGSGCVETMKFFCGSV